MQDLLNKHFPNNGTVVQNYGCFLCEVDRQTHEYEQLLSSLPVKPGDIVICQTTENENPRLPCIDLSKTSAQPRPFEIFFDYGHLTPDGNRFSAEKIFDYLIDFGLLTSSRQVSPSAAQPAPGRYGFDDNDTGELAEYKQILTNWYHEMFDMVIGSVVMNCNPFTLGHRYLVEKALEQCDYLAIFVVQENKSDFPFEDRLRLVDEGVADLKNVAVIPSGRFILSSLTFSEYFNKSELQDREIDTSTDVLVFAQEIAPCLHITKRFAGEEPFDRVTRQYNETMRRTLPEYGIEFVEIPRMQADGNAVSASRVRHLLAEGEFETLKSLVPETTFQYLCTRV